MLISLLRSALRPFRRLLVLIVALQGVATLASLYLPSLNGQIIDRGVVTGDTGFIVRSGGSMLAVSLVQIAATVAATYLGARVAAGVGRSLRGDVFARVVDLSAQEVARFGPSTLITRSTNDVTQVQQLVFAGLAVVIAAPITMVGGVVMALREDVGLSWLVAVAVPLLGVTVTVVFSRLVPHYRSMQDSIDGLNRVLREQITGIRVVRSFVREDVERERFAEANRRYARAALDVGRLLSSVFPVVMLIFNTATVAVVWFGARRVDAGDLQIGALIAFIAYLTQILMAVMMATFIAMMVPRAGVAAGRIMDVLGTRTDVTDPPAPRMLPDGPLEVELSEVSFTYPGADAPVLRDVTFTARPGETTAIIGSTGSGKSTILSLVARLADATSGSVRLGGVDVRDAALGDVWCAMGLVPQKSFLVAGTVADNLRYGNPEASDERLWDALRVAQAADFVEAMPQRLAEPIASGGVNVSGGQRQRLAIARAVVAAPSVYLFDDSFSALDAATDARLRDALEPVTAAATVLVVAQRVATIVDADQIVVLDEGAVVGTGTHATLLDTCPAYREIVRSQASPVEVA